MKHTIVDWGKYLLVLATVLWLLTSLVTSPEPVYTAPILVERIPEPTQNNLEVLYPSAVLLLVLLVVARPRD